MPKKRSKDPQKQRLLFISVSWGIFMIVFSIFNLLFYLSSSNNDVLGIKVEIDTKTSLLHELKFWKSFLNENPSYLQGWLELAKVEIQLENLDSARSALYEAKAISPNSKLVKDVEKELGLLGS